MSFFPHIFAFRLRYVGVVTIKKGRLPSRKLEPLASDKPMNNPKVSPFGGQQLL